MSKSLRFTTALPFSTSYLVNDDDDGDDDDYDDDDVDHHDDYDYDDCGGEVGG